MRSLSLTFAGLALAAALPAAAQANGHFVDASQLQIDYPGGLALAIGGSSFQRLAQTLTVEVGGTLVGVFMPISCGNGKLDVEIRDVVADGPGLAILASQRLRADAIATSNRFAFVKLPGALTLTAGQRVAIVVGNDKGTCLMNMSPATANYPGGRGLFEALPNPPGFIPFSDFAGSPDDLPFQLVLDP